MKNSFVDFIRIFCKSGDGGKGIIHFNRKRQTMKGSPDGGSGGNGGNIFIQGNSNIHTFIHLKYHKHWIANSGNPGKKNNITGSNGKNLLIEVPIGTVVKNEHNNIIIEITENLQKKILFKGGKGGKGNYFFKNSRNKNFFYAQNGIKTKGKWIILELKILSDISIIGLPNVGKSTLLSVLTNAKPKIGNFYFTNKIPYIGILTINFESFVVLDIPGIIEKSYIGKGLGNNFLRHIERSSILLLLISPENNNEYYQYKVLLEELNNFNKKLLNKKRILVISKSELISDNKKKYITNYFSNIKEKIIFVSSLKKNGLKNLIKNIFTIIKNN
ncbi:GTPase ObgE [Blattabacterium cuenoti]|uniref:GTPase ObgE n=1 Tax=Blattabacterium cuenoti TaxID=1653831 RepID=UPI00163CC09C|nr:GTPase ObgE [Blattabacterium cuenoti]